MLPTNIASSISSDSEYKGVETPITPLLINPDSVTTSSLHALQSTDQQKVIDIVDKLRRTSLSSIVELPQLIVCGDQSSGKSSILKAITEIPFPRKENLCTRFTTKIILRRSASSTSTITITPDKLRPKSEQAKLKSFSKAINDFSQLPDIIEEATQAIGLGVVGGINSRAFSRDVLSVKITSPARPQLTLVDLPGLIHATNKAQTETDKELILNLVKEYMKNPRTIILAVVSAKNDYANQTILDHCRKIDEQGRRTLGIITKPDFLREGTDNELTWIELAQNKDIYLERGWYMLKNRDEDLFFSKGRYAELPRECVGIGSLRERLSKVLLSHLIKELPSLKDEMVNKLQGTVAEIKKLGDRRNTTHKQRMVLMKISMRISDILNSATKGYYESSFFGPINMDAAVNVSENIRRFRAVIQHLNINFASNMRLRGHKYTFRVRPGDEEQEIQDNIRTRKELKNLEEHPELILLPKPKELTRQEEQITSQHINTIASAYREFIDIVLQDATPCKFKDRLTSLYVDGALAQALSNAKEELHKILKDKARHPATYNHYFTTTIQKMRQRKHQEIIEKASKASETSIYHRNDENVYTYLNPSKLTEAMEKAIELNMDVFSSQEALDTKRAFYKDKIKYFVNTITKAVIKRHLVAPLPKIILSPIVVTQITEKEVEFIATKSSEITQQRLYLESRKSMLEKGLETFREAMGGLKR
ncbi:P-loop containing nucleoside triphosphate hydrolase protein [Bipolaris maydis]|nr:P-loop containing nucleoside triphosphate hydrolase protein [Bipolaris maydis]